MATILVVDDDPHIREVVSFALEKAGFATATARDGRDALDAFERGKPDLVVLDITMPEMDGLEVCRELRARGRVPVVFLTSRDDEVDRIVGLEIGGDDYVAKPFSPRELVARVRAVLRRVEPVAPGAREEEPVVVERGRLRIDLETFKATWDGEELALTVTELGILRTLAERPGKVYSRDELMERAYPGSRIVSTRTIDSHVRRLRAKLRAAGGDPVTTVHGIGYTLAP